MYLNVTALKKNKKQKKTLGAFKVHILVWMSG